MRAITGLLLLALVGVASAQYQLFPVQKNLPYAEVFVPGSLAEATLEIAQYSSDFQRFVNDFMSAGVQGYISCGLGRVDPSLPYAGICNYGFVSNFVMSTIRVCNRSRRLTHG